MSQLPPSDRPDEAAKVSAADASAAEAMDAAARSAQARVTAPRRGVWTAVIALAVGLAGFFAGRQLTTAPPAGTAAAPTTADAAHDHDAQTLWTCSMHPQVIQPEPGICPICHMELTPLRSGGQADGGAVTIDPVVVQNMGVRTAMVEMASIVQSVRVVGYLEEPEPLHRDINLRVDGWIEKLYANIDGMAVEQGEPLFDLYSPVLSVAIDDLISANSRAGESPGDAMAGERIEASRRRLIQYGLSAAQVDELGRGASAPPTVPILSPMNGHLTAKAVYEGAAVNAGDLVMRLASRQRMWIDAQVPERQMSLITDGQPVRATLVSQPGRVFAGKVLFVHPHLDAQTRTALVRIEIDNQDASLRQGMYATVEILADAYREAPVVPREAVIDTGRRQLAFVALGEGRFEPRDLTLGLPAQDGTVEVVAGLKVGESVVTSGQFLLDSESRLKEAVAKHLSAGLPGHAGHGEQAGEGGGGAPAASAPASEPAATAVAGVPAGDRLAVAHADEIVQEYLTLSAALGEREESPDPLDPASLADLAAMAAGHSAGEGADLARRVATAAGSLAGKPLPEQRAAFVDLSDAVIDLARRAQRSDAAPPLYVMWCPMAFDDKGARWLQDHDTVANPFYATQMKRCGEVESTLPATAGAQP